jgi:hypothetical protein
LATLSGDRVCSILAAAFLAWPTAVAVGIDAGRNVPIRRFARCDGFVEGGRVFCGRSDSATCGGIIYEHP